VCADKVNAVQIRWTPHFADDFRRLPKDVQTRAEKAIRLLKENTRHPSLRTKKMEGTRGIYESRVTLSYRITYQIEDDTLVLRRIETHSILEKE
jgi:mRNA interferase RelE/StbE